MSDRLETIQKLATEMKSLDQKIKQAELHLKALKDKYLVISSVELPEVMAEVNMERFVLRDGTRFTVTPVVGIKPLDMDMADEWLAENGHDGMVKMHLEIPRGVGNKALKLILDFIRKQGVQSQYKKHIHPQTLAKWCREMDAEGMAIPEEIFSVFRSNKTVID